MSTGWRSSCELEKSAELWTAYNRAPKDAYHVFGSFETLPMKYLSLQLHKVIVVRSKGGGKPNIIHTNIWYPPTPFYVKRTQKCGFDCEADSFISEHSREFRGCYNSILIYNYNNKSLCNISKQFFSRKAIFTDMISSVVVICNLCSQINSGHLALTCT